MRAAVVSLLLIAIGTAPLRAQVSNECHALISGSDRIACYDVATGYSPEPEPASVDEGPSGDQWYFSEEKSALDARSDVWLSVESVNTEPNSIGRGEHASLWLRCMQNTTTVLLSFNSYTSDAQSVRYKLDDGKIKSIRMSPVKGGDGLGIWSGKAAIPFIKELIGKDKIVLAYSSFSNSNLEFTFDISGLQHKIKPLAAACKWSL